MQRGQQLFASEDDANNNINTLEDLNAHINNINEGRENLDDTPDPFNISDNAIGRPNRNRQLNRANAIDLEEEDEVDDDEEDDEENGVPGIQMREYFRLMNMGNVSVNEDIIHIDDSIIPDYSGFKKENPAAASSPDRNDESMIGMNRFRVQRLVPPRDEVISIDDSLDFSVFQRNQPNASSPDRRSFLGNTTNFTNQDSNSFDDTLGPYQQRTFIISGAQIGQLRETFLIPAHVPISPTIVQMGHRILINGIDGDDGTPVRGRRLDFSNVSTPGAPVAPRRPRNLAMERSTETPVRGRQLDFSDASSPGTPVRGRQLDFSDASSPGAPVRHGHGTPRRNAGTPMRGRRLDLSSPGSPGSPASPGSPRSPGSSGTPPHRGINRRGQSTPRPHMGTPVRRGELGRRRLDLSQGPATPESPGHFRHISRADECEFEDSSILSPGDRPIVPEGRLPCAGRCPRTGRPMAAVRPRQHGYYPDEASIVRSPPGAVRAHNDTTVEWGELTINHHD